MTTPGGAPLQTSQPSNLTSIDPPAPNRLGWLGTVMATIAFIGSVASIWSIALLRGQLTEPEWGLRLVDVVLFTTFAALVALIVQQTRHQRRLQQKYAEFTQERRSLISDHNRAIIELGKDHLAELRLQERQARTAKAAHAIHAVLHSLRDVHALYFERASEIESTADLEAFTNSSELYAALRTVLRNIVSVFELTTGEQVRACIKLLGVSADAGEAVDPTDDTKFLVWTLCRNNEAEESKFSAPDPLHRNSDFRNIFDKDQPRAWFISNNLDTESGYQNPHRPPKQDPDLADYNSTMVWGIQHKEKDGEEDNIDLLGFLCVDSKATDVFDATVDFELGAGFADSLYPVLTYCGLGGPWHRYGKG